MKEQIRKICTQLNDGQIAVSQATEQILDLFAVSGSLPTDLEIESIFPVDNKWAIEDRTHAIGKRQGAKWMRDKIVGNNR